MIGTRFDLSCRTPLEDSLLALRVEEEAGRFKRFGHPVSVVSLDLDNFDRINRKAGHPGGDAVLREIGVLCGGTRVGSRWRRATAGTISPLSCRTRRGPAR